MAEAQAAIKTASPPFDRPDADLVLRSCDGIDFRVYKSVLSLVSPVFETMFTLPQPGPKVGASEPPVVQMTEDERTLYLVLQFCYPGRRLELKDLTDMVALLEFAEKHDFEEWLVSCVKRDLVSHAEEDAVGVYAVAMRFKLKSEAVAAARSCLRLPRHKLYIYHPMLSHISVNVYTKLLQYHYDCGQALRELGPSNLEFMRWAMSVPLPGMKCAYRNYDHTWYRDFAQSISSYLEYQPSTLKVRALTFDKNILSTPMTCKSCGDTVATNTLLEYAEQFAQYADIVVSKKRVLS